MHGLLIERYATRHSLAKAFADKSRMKSVAAIAMERLCLSELYCAGYPFSMYEIVAAAENAMNMDATASIVANCAFMCIT